MIMVKNMRKFEICRDKALDYICRKKEFGIDELCNDILRSGGVLRISTGQSLIQFLEKYEELEYIQYIPKDNKYIVLKP